MGIISWIEDKEIIKRLLKSYVDIQSLFIYTFSTQKADFDLFFALTRCFGCGLCINACLDRAIMLVSKPE